MKGRSMVLPLVVFSVLLPVATGIFVEIRGRSPFLGIAEGVPSTSYAAVCPQMGQSLPCKEKETVNPNYSKCTNISEGCCQYTCKYVKACDNNYYEICSDGTLERGKNCDSASGKCY